MFIVFEGIDGSGKSTVSDRVAKMLRARGIPVEHVREDGSYGSPLVERIREFSKDTRNLAMTAQTELFLNVAREVQLITECIRPALSMDALVIADRYLYSHAALAVYGRGVPNEQVRNIIASAADGLWPELVVLLDVDPYIARVRRKVSKLAKKQKREREPKDTVGGSRKNLQGLGLQHLLRHGYREMAERDPERWLVLDNSDPLRPDSALYKIVARAADAIAARWEASHPPADNGTSGRKRSRMPEPNPQINIRPPTLSMRPLTSPTDFASARQAFFDSLLARSSREIDVAAYFLSRLDDEVAWQLREKWAASSPHAIAYGLRGLADERAWDLRERLAEISPLHVARSLSGRSLQGERVWDMRDRFCAEWPEAVLATIKRDRSEIAWQMRERLFKRAPEAVIASLSNIESERAWKLRGRYSKDALGDASPPPLAVASLVESLTGLADERAWALRDRYLETVPTAVLASIASLADERAWSLRYRFVAHAPKIVLRTFDRFSDEKSWELRARYAPWVKEAVDSMTGNDEEEAWEIRERCLDIWPSTVVKSLGMLGLGERGKDMALRVLSNHGSNISLLKHITRLHAKEHSVRDEGDRPPS